MSIFIIFISALFVQQIYHLFVFSRIAFYKSASIDVKSVVPISVVICCRNEKTNLQKYLSFLLQQQYSNFEILIVDDDSIDGTKEYIEWMMKENPLISLRYLAVNKTIAGKKQVLYEGVQAAHHEYVLVTDADCKPSTDQWIQMMSNAIRFDTAMVLGHAPFNEQKSSLVNLISRFENFITACFFLSFAMARIPYMGVGRNMLFKRTTYIATYDRIVKTGTISGDDDLFVQFAANRQNCEVCIDASAFMYSDAKKSWKDFFQQKARHVSTGFFYKWSDLLALAMYPLSMLLVLIAFVSMLVKQSNEMVFACVILVIYLFMIYELKSRAAKVLRFKSTMPILVLNIFFLIYQIFLVIFPFKSKKAEWQSNTNNRNEPKMMQNW